MINKVDDVPIGMSIQFGDLPASHFDYRRLCPHALLLVTHPIISSYNPIKIILMIGYTVM